MPRKDDEDRLDLGALWAQSGNVDDDDYAEQDEEGPGFGDNSGEEPKNLELNDLLKQLQLVVGNKMLQAIMSGQASEKDFANAIRFLKDNGMVAGYGAPEDQHDNQPADLPDLPDPSYS
jgi:hypothetical protein